MLRNFLLTSIQAFLLLILLASVLSISFAQVRSSTNYSLQSDSINIGGGLSSSTNYTQESTVGEVATGLSSSTNYQLRAGYQQMQEVYLSLTPPANVVMDTALPGLTGGTSNGSTTFAVTTDSPSGYQVIISAENSPAMQNGPYSIADYNDGGDADNSFLTSGGDAHLGYTIDGSDTDQYFLDSGGVCGTGSTDSFLTCWTGLSTSDKTIVRSSTSNHPAGAEATIYFRVGIGSSAGVIAGTYVATSTLTALPL